MKSIAAVTVALMASAALAGCHKDTAASNGPLVVGFSQIGSESGWRTAETKMAVSAAKERNIDLRVSDAQQQQENQIKAIRSFVAQGVSAIFLAPVVSTGWDQVLGEARDAKIPVILLDRQIETKDPSLFLTSVAANNVTEGQTAANWLIKAVGSKPCSIVEIEGTVGSTLVADRKRGFDEAVAAVPNLKLVRSQTGEFTRAKGKEVMEGYIKALGGKSICAVYAHNDDMMIGAIQAMKEAGLKPGKDILTVSIDGVPDIFKAMADGDANATVELDPNMGARGMDALLAYRRDKTAPPKLILTPSTLFLPDTAAAEYERRKDLY